MHKMRELWWLLDSIDIQLRPLSLRSAINFLADYASRLAAKVDYMIDPALLGNLPQCCERCIADFFASPAKAQLPCY